MHITWYSVIIQIVDDLIFWMICKHLKTQRLSDLYIILFFIYNFSRQMQTLMYMVPVKTLYIRENFLKNFNTLSKLSLSMLESSIRCIRRLGTTRNGMCTKTNYSISVNLQTGLLRIHFTFIYCLLNSVQKRLFGLILRSYGN